ncbi:protein BCCIP homolog [Daktulosphaira vitifoliae]|uniref:protein BCCIP homolog n=1 Tax=Daktulosphaira vitifoliae TaxID=58002 RepID=UPI0021AAA8BC|nr:protein BCCIP homolog [Daktulosphaira vitifoliae]
MSAPAKKRSIEPRKSIGNASEDDNIDQMMIDVEFEGRNPESSDFHGVKQLLQQLFLKAQLNVSDMASVLVNQQSIGSVIKQVFDDEDDDDDVDVNQVFGITTILNITEQKSECIEQLQKLMLNLSKQHGEPKVVEFINDYLVVKKKPLALLVNERYVNIPPAISVPLLQSVSKELTNIKNKNTINDFSYFIMICKLYKMKEHKNKKSDQVIWSNAEEEIFDEESDYTFEFCVKDEKDSGLAGSWEEGDCEMIPYRRVLFFKSDKLDSIIKKIQNMLS